MASTLSYIVLMSFPVLPPDRIDSRDSTERFSQSRLLIRAGASMIYAFGLIIASVAVTTKRKLSQFSLRKNDFFSLF